MGMGGFVLCEGDLSGDRPSERMMELERMHRLARMQERYWKWATALLMSKGVSWGIANDAAWELALQAVQPSDVPEPDWVAGALACEGCGRVPTVFGQRWHWKGSRITGCGHCHQSPFMQGGRTEPRNGSPGIRGSDGGR